MLGIGALSDRRRKRPDRQHLRAAEGGDNMPDGESINARLRRFATSSSGADSGFRAITVTATETRCKQKRSCVGAWPDVSPPGLDSFDQRVLVHTTGAADVAPIGCLQAVSR